MASERFFGKICPKHPGAEGWRIKYKCGSTICAVCNTDRVREWRLNNPDKYAKHKKVQAARQQTPTVQARRRMTAAMRAAITMSTGE